MKSIKTWILALVTIVLAAYILFAGRLIAPARSQSYALQADIHVKDSVAHPYVKAAEIRQLLLVHQLLDDSLLLDSLHLAAMEAVVESHPLVKKAEVYTRPSGYLRIDVEQRLPVMRVIADESQFFIDAEGKCMNMQLDKIGSAVDVPVVTGQVQMQDSVLIARLYEMALYLQGDKFWDAMITQMQVHSDGKMSMYLRLCDFEVAFGKIENLPHKFAALRSFYQEALPKVGWDVYKKVSLEFDNQIVCTKK